eukprot:c819_g1_i2.p1 GENE.c819_g1_i2~~c819_g1_i2.p1  ORF type:complete len:237 (-),score=40.41 c819_g1_i2:51-761(-)
MGCRHSQTRKNSVAPLVVASENMEEKAMELQIKNEEDAAYLLSLRQTVKWQGLRREQDATLGWCLPNNSRIIMSLGITEMNVPAQKVVDFVFPKTKDDCANFFKITSGGLVVDLDYEMRGDVGWIWLRHNYGVRGIKDREGLFAQRHFVDRLGNHFVIISNLAQWDKHPPSKEYVRGHLGGITGYVIRPLSENSCEVALMCMSDLKGWFPTWLSNMFATNIGRMVILIRNHLQSTS